MPPLTIAVALFCLAWNVVISGFIISRSLDRIAKEVAGKRQPETWPPNNPSDLPSDYHI